MPSASTSGSAPLGRIFWIMVGPALLFLLALSISRDDGGWFTLKDIAFLSILSGLIVGRYLEFRGGTPKTATGEPATHSDLGRYAAIVIPCGLIVWVGANLVGNRFI